MRQFFTHGGRGGFQRIYGVKIRTTRPIRQVQRAMVVGERPVAPAAVRRPGGFRVIVRGARPALPGGARKARKTRGR